MNLETQVNVAAVAQGEDDADMRQQDRELVTITQRIDVAKTLMGFNMEQAAATTNQTMKDVFMNKANVYATSIEELSEDLMKIGATKRKKNEIVATVLEHAAVSMGIKRNKKDGRGAADGEPNVEVQYDREYDRECTSDEAIRGRSARGGNDNQERDDDAYNIVNGFG